MLANPRAPWQVPFPPYARLVVFLVAGILLYAAIQLFDDPPTRTDVAPTEEVSIAVPQVDAGILGAARDASRQERLVIEPEPLRHLLEVAIDVTPSVAFALGMPEEPVAVAEVQAHPDHYRGRWLWYKGILEDIAGPRDGHPVKGHSIYEATIRLDDGNRAICAFSLPPGDDVHRGGFVRIEGFLLKLRDTTYPQDIAEAPMLVGRQLQRDYEDWAPVTEFDPALLADIRDNDPFPGAKMWHDVEEDQGMPLWHLAAFARDTRDARTFEQWRREPVLNVAQIHDKLVAGEIPRGAPIRVLGTLVKRRAIAAAPNPAGIDYWTVAYVQCRDYAGYIVPIWVPKRVLDIPLRTDLEVRGFFYRWYAYESIENIRLRVPLFVAADLDLYDIGVDETMQTLGIWIGSALMVLMLLIAVGQWRARRDSDRHAREMDARRRRRRERAAVAGP